MRMLLHSCSALVFCWATRTGCDEVGMGMGTAAFKLGSASFVSRICLSCKIYRGSISFIFFLLLTRTKQTTRTRFSFDHVSGQCRPAHASDQSQRLDFPDQAALTRARRYPKAIQSQLDGVVYPVLTLPHEITSEIFLQCLPPVSEYMLGGTTEIFNVSVAPLLLIKVCQAWRSIAVATPRLWAHLHLDLEGLSNDPDLEKVIAVWFSRAGSCPLSFSIQSFSGMEGFEWAAIRTAFLRHAPLLQSVSFQVEKEHFSQLADIGPFPLLKKLATLAFDGKGSGRRVPEPASMPIIVVRGSVLAVWFPSRFRYGVVRMCPPSSWTEDARVAVDAMSHLVHCRHYYRRFTLPESRHS
ncbi:hypothetical protein C8R44DRAFT_384646 [Mycena epipterygia]|nr:hypothetical protein C8R44DRAFT_384646 [Mycena epipterygia]